jgi:hypothetical protein
LEGGLNIEPTNLANPMNKLYQNIPHPYPGNTPNRYQHYIAANYFKLDMIKK